MTTTPRAKVLLLQRVARSFEGVAPAVDVFAKWEGAMELRGVGVATKRDVDLSVVSALSRWLAEADVLDRYSRGQNDRNTLIGSWDVAVRFLGEFGDVFHEAGHPEPVSLTTAINALARLRFGFGLATRFDEDPEFWLTELVEKPGYGGDTWKDHLLENGMSEDDANFPELVVRLWVQAQVVQQPEPHSFPRIWHLGGAITWEAWPRTVAEYLWWTIAVTIGAMESTRNVPGAYKCAGCGVWFIADRSRARKDTQRRFHDDVCRRRFHARKSARERRAHNRADEPAGNRKEN